jgi:hypothetical protein
MDFTVACFEAAPEHLHVQTSLRPGDMILRRVEVEADEMHSFVKKKANEQWLWLAIDRGTRALQQYLGHRNIQHTVRYIELTPQRFQDFWND